MNLTIRNFLNWKTRTHLLAVVSVVGLVAVACGSSDSAPVVAPVAQATATTQSATATPNATVTGEPTRLPPTSTPIADPTATQVPDAESIVEDAPSSTEPLVDAQSLNPEETEFVAVADSLGWETDWSLRTVPLTDISISLRRDSIRPIDDPTYLTIDEANEEYDPKEPFIIVELNDDARAYPLSVLVNHEIVNDEIGGVPVTVTFCPLCNSSIVFDRRIDGIVHRFGTSGMLRNSDLVMWDDTTETLWQQLTGEGIVGEQAGKKLTFLPAQIGTLESFMASSPGGQVMAPPAGRAYLRSSYQGYDDGKRAPFLFFGDIDPRLNATDRITALDLGTGPVAYRFDYLAKHLVTNVESGGLPIVIFFDDTTESAFRSTQPGAAGAPNISGSSTTYLREVGDLVLTFVENGDGRFRDEQTGSIWDRFGEALEGELAGTQLDPIIHGDHFWFAWAAFHPDTELITYED
jgi:hypothetical protein